MAKEKRPFRTTTEELPEIKHNCWMEWEDILIYQGNLSCVALMERGRSGAERTRHIDIRYFWLTERVKAGEAIIRDKRTLEMYASMLTKPLQFLNEREALTGWA